MSFHSVKYYSHDDSRAMHLIEMCECPDFNDGVAVIRAKWNISPDELDDGERVLKIEDTDIYNDVLELLKRLDIPEHWSEIVHIYVVEDSVYPYFDTDSFLTRIETGVKLYKDLDHLEKSYVVAGVDATKEEFNLAFDDLQKIIGVRKKKRRNTATKRSNFLRDLTIYHLAREGKTIVEIDAELKKRFGKGMDYGAIKKALSNFCDRVRIPREKRPRLYTRKKSAVSPR